MTRVGIVIVGIAVLMAVAGPLVSPFDPATQALPLRLEGPTGAHWFGLDELGRDSFMGYVIKAGRWTVYHSGDTVMFPGMVERLKPFGVDLALLPINGRAPERLRHALPRLVADSAPGHHLGQERIVVY